MKALTFENVSFAYAGDEPVLDEASFEVSSGEFIALIGENGSGKSTIAKMADAFILPNSGKVTVLGNDVSEVAKRGSDALLELRCNVGFVQQNPDNQFVATRVIDEVAFGPCGLAISKDEVLSRVQDALRKVDSEHLAIRDVNTLSGGQKQRIAIADALSMQPELFIFDEPTSMLDDEGKHEIMQIIRNLHEDGATIILITHSAIEANYADRVLKIENGKISESNDFLEAEEAAFEHAMQYASELREKTNSHYVSDSGKSPLVKLQDVSFTYDTKNDLLNGLMGVQSEPQPVFDNFNLDILEGELLCIAGPNGSGKSTLASLMNGLLRPTNGDVLVKGTSTSSKHGANSARRHVGVCLQYPERSLFCQTVLDEVAFGPKNLGFEKQEAEAMAREALQAVGIDSESILNESPFSLSGGMQRKVAFASVLAMKPDVLVMDEPCAGLDIASHAEFLLLLLGLKEQGQSMVLITHDERDMKILADRVVFLG